MSVLGRLLISSAERLDLPDFLAIDSYAAGDWKYFLKGLVGDNNPYILKGFDVIDPDQSIGSTNISIRTADSMVFYPGSSAGSFFHGLQEGNELSQPLIPELKKNATNYVYLTLDTVDSAQDTRSFWDPDKEGGIGGEFTQDVNTESVLVANINVSVSSFPQNTIPVCKVVVAADFIESIEDNRDLMFRLGSGGMSSTPYNRFEFKELPSVDYTRSEPSSTITNSLNPNPFQGGDKNIYSLKEWMDAVMTKLAELGGTTYWYEDTHAYNMINTFSDSLATSIKSKGQWQHSETVAGKIIWTEDVISQSLQDNRDYIIRAGEKTLANNELMFIHLERELPPNEYNYPLTWFNGINHVNGSTGAFTNLKKGDWIKKTDDDKNKYLRVEEFYLLSNKGGGITAPSNAQSVKLSDVYAGSGAIVEGVYCRGIYDNVDVKVEDRANTNVLSAGGDLFWLAFRSDTIMSVTDATATVLSLDISEQDGTKAKVTCTNNSVTGDANHMLEDNERIRVNGSVNYDGTYMVEKIDDTVFYIYTTETTDESVTAYYGTITTGARYTSDGLLLETANHNFETNQIVSISDTASSWDNDGYNIFVKSDNKFTVPIASNIANAITGLTTLARLNVRTEISQAKIAQGEVKYVGEVDSENIRSFIGMESITQTNPNYHIDGPYNTLYGTANYNTIETEDLTSRVSKLTAMMADKAQDKTIKIAADYNICVKTTNGANQEITFLRDGGNPKLTIVLNSSQNNNTINLTNTLTLAENKVAFFNVDRNADNTILDLSALTIVDFKDVPLTESVFIFAYRLDSERVWLWNQRELIEGNNTLIHVLNEIINDNAYDESINITSGAPVNSNEFQGPVAPGTNIPMPLDSRDAGAPQGYVVGKGVLEIVLNGIALKLGSDWSEVGVPGSIATVFRIDIDLVVGDELQVRIDTFGGYINATGSTGGGTGEANYGTNIGGQIEVYKTKVLEALQFRTIKSGPGITIVQNADDIEISTGAGATLSVVTKSADYTATSTDDVILVDATSADVRITLPTASTSNGLKLDIKKIDSSSFNMIVDADGSETIDGVLTQSTNTQYESFTIVCNGSAWFII